MSDLTITCKDCQHEFVFTEGEQEFYQSKDLDQPIYCPICRGRHKAKEKQFAKYNK